MSSNFHHQSEFSPLSLRSFRFTWRPPAVLHTSYKTLDIAAIHTLTCIAALRKRQFLPLVCCMKRYKQEVSCWHSLTMESLAFLTIRVFSQRQKWRRIRRNRMEVRGKERLGAAALLRHFPRNYETKKRGHLRNKVCRWRRRFISRLCAGKWHDCLFLFDAGPPVRSAPVQKRAGYGGNILHYIYRSSLGQSLHSQMRQVGLHGGTQPAKKERVYLPCIWSEYD